MKFVKSLATLAFPLAMLVLWMIAPLIAGFWVNSFDLEPWQLKGSFACMAYLVTLFGLGSLLFKACEWFDRNFSSGE